MNTKVEAKKYMNKYFKAQYINENDDEFKALVRLLNKSKKTVKDCNIPHVMPSLQSLNFKIMRKEKGLTLRQVEEMTGISNPYLSQLETGKIVSPSYNIVRTLVMLYSNEA